MKQKNPIFMIATLILAIILLFGLVACDKNSSKLDDSSSQTSIILNEDPNPVSDEELVELIDYFDFVYVDYPEDESLHGYLAQVDARYSEFWGLINSNPNQFYKITCPDTYNDKPVIGLAGGDAMGAPNVYSIKFPKNLWYWGWAGSYDVNKISIADDAPYYRVENNCLITKQSPYSYENGTLMFANGYLKEIPASVKVIHQSAILYNPRITELTVPSSVIKITRLVCDCENLKTITIPDGITYEFDQNNPIIKYGHMITKLSLETINFGGTKEKWQELEGQAYQGYTRTRNDGTVCYTYENRMISIYVPVSESFSYTVHCSNGDLVYTLSNGEITVE